MDKYRKRRAVAVAHEMVDLLAEKGYITYYAENVEEARDKVLELIPKGASVGVGGSETLKAMDMINILRNGDYHFFDRYQEGLPFSEVEEIYRQALLADVFLTSSNAITRQGQLVNIDSSGNRVAAISYGPRKVIVVARGEQGCRYAGRRDEARVRSRRSTPMRVHHKAPCVETGKCMDCQIQQSVCNSVGIINHGRKTPGRFTIIMIADEIGF